MNTQRALDPFRFLLIAVSGWMNHRQLQVIEYLREENRALREQLGGRRVRLNDNQRRRLEGYRRMEGALSHLGHELARSTIAAINGFATLVGDADRRIWRAVPSSSSVRAATDWWWVI